MDGAAVDPEKGPLNKINVSLNVRLYSECFHCFTFLFFNRKLNLLFCSPKVPDSLNKDSHFTSQNAGVGSLPRP